MGVNKEENFKAVLLQHFNEQRVFGGDERFTSKVIDRLLMFGHARDIVYIEV